MDNQDEKTTELTGKQMEKVSGGVFQYGTDCYKCPGTVKNSDGTESTCECSLQQVSGKKYRCINPFCSLLAQDQYPAGQ